VQERAGVERFRPYDLRHSAATGALASGADVVAVQALLGHTDLKTTQGYLHASEARRKAAAERAATFGRGVLK
jgi:integrase/recombinase XerD